MITLRLILRIVCISLLAGALGLLLWANIPPRIDPYTRQMHLIAPVAWGEEEASSLAEIPYTLTVACPTWLKSGQESHCRVELSGLPETIEHAGVRQHLWIRSELILPGMLNQQEGMITELVHANQPVSYTWEWIAPQPLQTAGEIRIDVVYGTSFEQGVTQLLSVTDLEVNATGLAGLTTTTANSLAIVLIVVSGLLGTIAWSPPRASA